MTTNPYAEAVEAARKATTSPTCCSHDVDPYEVCLECAVAAAVGPLLAPVRERMASHKRVFMSGHCECLACDLLRLCDAIEAGATSEGGQS